MFKGMIDQGAVDLTAYLESQEVMAIRSVAELWREVRAEMFGEARRGLLMPWSRLHERFDIRRGEMTVWAGWKGHGKSLLVSHVIAHLVSQGEKALIVSPEFRAAGVLQRKVVQVCGCDKPTEIYAERAAKWLNGRVWILDHQGLTPWQKVVGALRYGFEKHGITQAVVDSLMKCGIAPDDFERQKQFVDRLQTFAHDSGCHVHLVAHARKGADDSKAPGLHDVKGASEICDMAENVVSVWKNKKKHKKLSTGEFCDEEDGLLVVDSQRNHSWTGMLKLWFHPCGQFLQEGQQRPTEYLA